MAGVAVDEARPADAPGRGVTGYGYATVDEVMAIYGVSRQYVYKMAHEAEWGRYRHPDGRVRYRREDAAKTLSGGAARRDARAGGKVRD